MHLSDKIKTAVPLLALVLVGFVVAYQFVDPAPPKSLTISAGSKQGAYYAHALAFRDYLKPRGIELNVLESAGSGENLVRLHSGSADVAFVQSGVAEADDAAIRSLGSIYYEPLWLFVRKGYQLDSLASLRGQPVAIGIEGSGTRMLALQLLHENGLDAENTRLQAMSGSEAADALIQGKVEAMFMVGSADAVAIRDVAARPELELFSFRRAEAYTRRSGTLSSLSLPEGALDMAANVPARNTMLLAATATLVINKNLHPALQDLLMQAASARFSGHSLLSDAGSFPTPLYAGIGLSDAAERYYRSGPSFLQRLLPFWAATLVDRLKVMLLPFIALLLPLFKVAPPLYRWRVRSRIYRWYDELNRIDLALVNGFDAVLLAELDRIEADIRKIHVPLSYADELYNLRMHLALIRKSARQLRPEGLL